MTRDIQDHITARSITPVDDVGRPRIILDASGDGSHAYIRLISSTGAHLELHSQPDGTVAIAFDHPPRVGQLTITSRVLDLRAPDGRLGITIGDFFAEGSREVTVYRDGEPIWKMPPDAE